MGMEVTSSTVDRIARHEFVRIAKERGLLQVKVWRKIPMQFLPPQWLQRFSRQEILTLISYFPTTTHLYPIASNKELEDLRKQVRAQTTVAKVTRMLREAEEDG